MKRKKQQKTFIFTYTFPPDLISFLIPLRNLSDSSSTRMCIQNGLILWMDSSVSHYQPEEKNTSIYKRSQNMGEKKSKGWCRVEKKALGFSPYNRYYFLQEKYLFFREQSVCPVIAVFRQKSN